MARAHRERHHAGSLAQKVARNKPADARDACFSTPAAPDRAPSSTRADEIKDPATCARLFPHYGVTRTAAGGPMTDDIIQCRRKPLNPADYRVRFTDAQLATLRRAFPGGVCDYRKPGVGQQPSQPWTTLRRRARRPPARQAAAVRAVAVRRGAGL